MAGGINRFNRISSKEWLPFQKSWFRYEDDEKWIRSSFRFFTTKEETDYEILYHGPSLKTAQKQAKELGFRCISELEKARQPIQFAFIDLRSEIDELNPDHWKEYKTKLVKWLRDVSSQMLHRRFLMVALPNIISGNSFYPVAWDLAQELGAFITLKDEKIAGYEGDESTGNGDFFHPHRKHFYCLHFRKDENSGVFKTRPKPLMEKVEQEGGKLNPSPIPSWFILRPQRRKKKEILHPAKFPEELANYFIDTFTSPGENVFDPMSGTGSTQLAALMRGRNGYGTELSSFFAEIARERSLSFLFDFSNENPGTKNLPEVDIIEGDARKVLEYGFPGQDLILTSPPYWDMLNMKGAENQAKRIKKGLQTNYSEDENDLGNIDDYEEFVKELAHIYFDVIEVLKPGGYIVIVVKNIKKKGRNYPFAWDLSALLQEKLILLPEVFWCQDDISIAPYGYGNTFVSNTFHQYCLIFQKPQK